MKRIFPLLLTFAMGCGPTPPLLDNIEDTVNLKSGEELVYHVNANESLFDCDTTIYKDQQDAYRACAFDELYVGQTGNNRCTFQMRTREKGTYILRATAEPMTSCFTHTCPPQKDPMTFSLTVVVEDPQIPYDINSCVNDHLKENLWVNRGK